MARSFNGTSDFIQFSRPVAVDGATKLTVLFNWIQPGSPNYYAPMLSWLDSSLYGMHFTHEQAIAGFPRVAMGDASSAFVAGSWGGVTAGVLARMCIVFDGTLSGAARVALYVNGSAPGTFLAQSGWPATAGNSTAALYLGTSAATADTYCNMDSLSEIAIFTRAFSADEIAAHAKGFIPFAGRVFYVPLIRDAVDLHGGAGSVTGTTVIDHPWMMYARGRRQVTVPHTYVAPTTTLHPDRDISAGSWTPSSGTSLAAMVNDDSDSTYIRSSTLPTTAKLKFPDSSMPGPGTITIRIRARKTP